jgi:hypothetical protein
MPEIYKVYREKLDVPQGYRGLQSTTLQSFISLLGARSDFGKHMIPFEIVARLAGTLHLSDNRFAFIDNPGS